MENYQRSNPNIRIPRVGVIYDWGLFKSDVRNDVRNCALFLFLFFAVYMIAAAVYLSVTTMTQALSDPDLTNLLAPGFSGETGSEGVMTYLDDPMANIDAGLMSIICIAAGSCVFFILRKGRFITDLALPSAEPMTPRIFIILVVITQCVQLVYSLIILLIDTLLPEGLSLEEDYASAMDSLFTPIGLLYIILLGPIFEELIFRGAIMGSLRRFGDNFAILLSSILFGFYHMQILQIPFGFVMGLLLGYVAVRWSLRASIALHIVVNGLSTLFSDIAGESLLGLVGLFMIACTVATAIMLIKWRKAFRIRVNTGTAYFPKTYAYGFSSIAYWVFVAVTGAIGFVLMNLESVMQALEGFLFAQL